MQSFGYGRLMHYDRMRHVRSVWAIGIAQGGEASLT